MSKILLIDDDEQVSDILSLVLSSNGFPVDAATEPYSALQLLARNQYDLILLDLRLGEHNGLDFYPKIRERAVQVPIFIITAHGDVDSAVQAFTLGAQGYIKKPFQEGDLISKVSQAIENYRLKIQTQSLHSVESPKELRKLIQSKDPVMDPVLQRITAASQVTSNVVITGESGTGKELVARALHQLSPRKQGPFVAFNCAAVPETLMESELFGHVKGAFTDAKEAKPGYFQRAHRGTLFLDEIGDAPLSIQAKLLRALQEKEILPLGASRPIPIDVRVVAATHKNLSQEVKDERFRQDLYYRLHVVPIHLPPLRERLKDIPFLAHLFANRLAREIGVTFEGYTPGALRAIQDYTWPGNVRELQNRIEQALALSSGGVLSASSLFSENPFQEDENIEENEKGSESDSQLTPFSELPTFGEAKNDFEKSYLERVLALTKGNIAKAARLASKSRTEVYSLLRKHRLDPGSFKSAGETHSD